jgi:cholesterol transport system auxiliary component
VKKVVSLSFLIFFLGCSEATLNTYTLSPKVYKKVNSSKFASKTLRVEYPKGIEDTMGTKIYYKDNNLKESFYLYSQWSKSLNRIIMGAIVDILRQSNLFKEVVDYSSTADVDYILETSIYNFEHEIKADKSFAKVKIQVRLLNSINNKIIKSKLFEYLIPCKSTDAKGFVEASNKALEKFGEDLIIWLK